MPALAAVAARGLRLSSWLRRVEELHRLQREDIRAGERLDHVDHTRV